jgi:hypothetical protein
MSGTRIYIRQPAPEATVFAPGCFDNAIGAGLIDITTEIGGVRIVTGKGRLIAAEVAPDGRSVLLGVEMITEEQQS